MVFADLSCSYIDLISKPAYRALFDSDAKSTNEVMLRQFKKWVKKWIKSLLHCRHHEADMRTGRATYWQLTTLQAFCPVVQILLGDIAAANLRHCEFFHVWKKKNWSTSRKVFVGSSDHSSQRKLQDYDFNFTKTIICCDNTIVIQMNQNHVKHSKSKHIDIRDHFIRDIVQKGKVKLFYVPSTTQLANIFTKPLDEKTLNKLIADLDMISMT
ncbi:unnamed protein product [Lactuca saligna]|uniref:Copia protein n=1 Tax=Lactuca saligna TaxID=75948 RepID=A0AA35YXE4_LACSI|nr:unnamed protein product [Lactuca saligna]